MTDVNKSILTLLAVAVLAMWIMRAETDAMTVCQTQSAASFDTCFHSLNR